jgi:hypothetical protein
MSLCAMTESKDHDKLFADLAALYEEQIEVGLAAGVWSEQGPHASH